MNIYRHIEGLQVEYKELTAGNFFIRLNRNSPLYLKLDHNPVVFPYEGLPKALTVSPSQKWDGDGIRNDEFVIRVSPTNVDIHFSV